jgi:hypothetical protein
MDQIRGSGNYVNNFYQNVRGLRTKSVEGFNNACCLNFKIVCLTETWLKKSFSRQNIFSEIYTAYGSDRDCHTKLHGGGASIVVSETVFGAKLRSDLEYFQEYVWVEITVADGRNLLIGNHSFSPDIMVDIIV